MESCYVSAAYFVLNATAYHLGWYSLHFLLLKSFIVKRPNLARALEYGQIALSVLIVIHNRKLVIFLVCHHSWVDSSLPVILLPRVQVPRTPSMLLSIYIDLCHVEKTKINKKRPGLANFCKNKNECIGLRLVCKHSRYSCFDEFGPCDLTVLPLWPKNHF